MTAIAGTRRALKELADGTIRVQIDIDPRFRTEFFQLFSQIDMPVALAPLHAKFEGGSDGSNPAPDDSGIPPAAPVVPPSPKPKPKAKRGRVRGLAIL